jgi:2-methylcitrate dehydratase PrpD
MTGALARFIASARWQDLPPHIRREAKRALLNISGCIIAGLREPVVRRAENALDDRAVILGAAANALDFDDTHLPTVIHPGPPVAAALFALAEKQSVSGTDFLLAYVMGVEAACRIGTSCRPAITSTAGTSRAAAACSARPRRLPRF